MKLRLRQHVLELEPGRPLVMGIVNANPDSFSDSVRLRDADAVVARAHELLRDGADLIDVGGESGVTYNGVSAEAVEIERVVPVVERLAGEGVVVSVDTWKPAVARAAVDAGAALLNDVSGLHDPALADVAASSGAGLVVMHTRAAPKQVAFPEYEDVVADVVAFLRERCALAVERGVDPEQLVLDPGPDFAKTPAESVEVLRALPRLQELGRPILLAVSRKDFVGALTNRRPRERLAGSLAAIGEGVDAGAAILRVHDVAEVRDFLTVRGALRGEANVPQDLRLAEDLRRQRT
jgi:dihydropteroate synthase